MCVFLSILILLTVSVQNAQKPVLHKYYRTFTIIVINILM